MLRRPWRRTPPRASSDWKGLLALAVFLLIWVIVLTIFSRPVMTLILACFLLPTSFVAGYLFRADLHTRGATPPLPFLRVEGDDN